MLARVQPVRALGMVSRAIINATKLQVVQKLPFVRTFSELRRKLPCGCDMGSCACRVQSLEAPKPCGCRGKCLCNAN